MRIHNRESLATIAAIESPRRLFSSVTRQLVPFGSLAVCLVVGGCGGDIKVAPVTGVVTLDGKPLERASVLFQPEKGRPSFGVTDKQGRYKLAYNRSLNGAEVGACTVKVTDLNNEQAAQVSPGEQTVESTEKPRERFSKEPMRVTVLPKTNTINIPLTSRQ